MVVTPLVMSFRPAKKRAVKNLAVKALLFGLLNLSFFACYGGSKALANKAINSRNKAPAAYKNIKLPFKTYYYFSQNVDNLVMIAYRFNISVEGLLFLNPHLIGKYDIWVRLPHNIAICVPLGRLSPEMSRHFDELIGVIAKSKPKISKKPKAKPKKPVIMIDQEALRQQEWRDSYGVIRNQLFLSYNDELADGGIDMLVKLYQKPQSISIFWQNTLAHKQSRLHLNSGFGIRGFYNNFMVGVNEFLEYDLTSNSLRGSIGAEYWHDYVRFSANLYGAPSAWQWPVNKAAFGFDVRAIGFLPSYPQFGFRWVVDKYFGSQLARFTSAILSDDQYNVAASLIYNPIPALNFALSYNSNPSFPHFTFGVNFSYYIGVSFKEQFNSENLKYLRSLRAAGVSLVERNNTIIRRYVTSCKDRAF